MRPERIAAFLGAALFLASAGTSGQAIPLDLEIGYRFVDVNGNRDMYRSQINDREGVLLRSLTFSTGTVGGSFLDSLRVDAYDMGVGPAGRFRLEAGKTGVYRVRVDYRRMEFFSALPAFANPLLDRGIIPGQHTYDRTRHLLDVEAEILPNGVLTPIVGYTLNRFDGPARTTYVVGGDEFRLASDLEDTEQEARVGVAFHAGDFAGRVVQGWRQFRETERLTLASGEGAGNNAGPVLGTPVSLTDFQRDSRVKINVPVTTAFLVGRFANRVKVSAGYLRANSDTSASETEDLTGNLVSFQISRFFQGLSEPISSRARNEQWRGHGRVEVEIADGFDLSAGYMERHRELDGFALISSLFLDTLTFSGQDPRDLERIIEANTSLERTEKIFDASFDARRLGPLALRVGYEQNDQDVRITPDPEEIVVPGGQGGDFDRRVQSWSASANFSRSGITLGADYRHDKADDAIVRVDFIERDRYRVRAGWSLADRIRLSANGEQVDVSNDDPGIGFDGRIRQYGGDLEVVPVKPFTLRFSASRFESRSTIPIRQPQDFSVITSSHRERGTWLEGGALVNFARFRLEGAFGRLENKGTFPFDIDRARARAEFDWNARLTSVLDWNKDKYSESPQHNGNIGGFDANRYGVFLRVHL
ncbi:MAG TPA: hypothetical protein VKS03_07905 [Thermoanaerobaculia bacterium]|nr:hypothetical protein [Thermoanaerobaculia bacterium]